MKFRYFPWLGWKTLNDEETEAFDLDTKYSYKAFTFEWGPLAFLIWGKGTLKEDDGNKFM